MEENMVLGYDKRAVGVFSNRNEAEQALNELRDAGFAMDRISIVAKDAERGDQIAGTEIHDRAHGNKADEGVATGAATGGALGALTGLLVGLGAIAIPGIGPVMLAGATATALATTLSGGAIGAVAGGLIGALIGLGIPEDRARVYSDRVSQGDYLVMVEGSDADISRAETILRRGGIQEWGIYDIPDSHTRGDIADTAHSTGDRVTGTSTTGDRVTVVDNRNLGDRPL
ncbi:MAG TPA: general stress protein [Candidatus Obscuribacterales bacterium]